jgi:hypothetical protein
VRAGVLGQLLLGAAGLAVFVYGDVLSRPALRIAGAVLVTVAVVVAAILSATRDHDRD